MMKNKINKLQKGQFGYVDHEKKKMLIISILSLLSVLIIFFTGLIIYKTNKSLFSVIAAVASLPAAKLITRYIVILPYKTGKRELYNRLLELKEENTQYSAVTGGDFIISSTAKNMFISMLYINNEKLLCYTDNKKTNAKELEAYIKEIFKNENCQFSQIKVYDNEQKFLSNVELIHMEIGREYPDRRIFEKLCAYSM